MGCNCKDKSAKGENETENKLPLFTKIVNIISISLVMIILSPVIFIIIWVMGINSAVGGTYNPLIEIAKLLSGRKDKDEISEDLDPDDYELLDVEVIK